MSTDEESQTRSWLGWVQIAIIAAVVVVAIVLTSMLSGGGGGSGANGAGDIAATPAAPVRVTEPDIVDHSVLVTLTGTVQAKAFVSLTPQVGGRVVQLAEAVREGGSFEAGETLFRIDPRDYEVAVARARATLADAQSALLQAEAEAQVARREWDEVYPEREITPLAAREPQLEAARARLLSARADLDQALLNLERTTVSFPFDGRVTESRIEVGQLVIANQSYGEVYNAEAVEILAPIPSGDLARLDGARGRIAELIFEDGTRTRGEIVREGARLDDRSRLINLFIAPSEPDALRPGQFADIRIEGPTLEGVARIPAAALSGVDQVHVVREGAIERVAIEVRDRDGGVVFAEPFDTGEGLIVSPLPETAIGGPAEIVERVSAPLDEASR